MKKLLSIVLTVALLLSMFAVIPVSAAEGEETAAITTALGDYYKFTFGADGDQYDYVVSSQKADDTTGQATFKGNTFYPLWAKSDSVAATPTYKTITLSDGEEVEVLEIKNTAEVMFTPLDENGNPFEMVPGVKYNVVINAFNPACATWGQTMVVAGTTNNKETTQVVRYRYAADGTAVVEDPVKTNPVHKAVLASGGTGSVSGNAYAVYLEDGTYGRTAMAVSAINPQYNEEFTGVASRNVNAYYAPATIIEIPEAVSAGYDEESDSYSTKFVVPDETPDDTSDDTYINGNNYLTLMLSGGNAMAYKADASIPVYTNATKEEIDEAGAIPACWQIESIEIVSENFESSLSYSVNGEIVKTVEGEPGIELEAPAIPEAPEGKYFAAWYEDEACTKAFTGTTLEFGQKTVYAGFKDYGTSIKVDFENGTYPATAIQYTAAGSVWPLRGYSWKGNSYDSQENKGQLTANLERNGLSTEFPASAVAFYSDRTWGMPGGIFLANEDGTLFVPKAGATYRVTYKYMAPVHNGNNMAINIVYGIPNALAGASTSGDKACFSSTLKWNTVTEAVTEWTTKTETVTIPAANETSVPALGLNIAGVRKVAVYEEDGETVKYYDYSAVLLDSIEAEEIPVYTVTFMNADGTEHSTAPVEVGGEIPYPALTAEFNVDKVWSLSATEYVAVPETLEKAEGLTVYVYDSTVLSYENYPVYTGDAVVAVHGGAIAYDSEMGAVVSDKDAYTGEKSMRLRNYGMQWVVTEAHYNSAVANGAYKYDAATDSFVLLEEVPEFVVATPETIADGTAFAIKRISEETGMNIIHEFGVVESVSFTYKISFKYKATENNTTSSTLSARVFAKNNIWWGKVAVDGSFTFAAGATDGWQDGVMYVSAENVYGGSVAKQSQVLDLKFNGNSTLNTNEIYIDDIVIEEVEGLGYVTYVNGDSTSTAPYLPGDKISYPAIPGVKGYDTKWSLNADAYEAVPETFASDITVYAINDTVIGFENYVGHNYSSNTNLNVVDFEGNKVMKAEDNDYTVVTAAQALKEITTGEGDEAVTTTAWLTPGNNYYWAGRFMLDEEGTWVKLSDVYEEAPEFEEGKYYSNRNNSIDHAISLWQLEVGKTYKVSFKYYLPEALTKEYRVLPITSQYANIWYAGQQKTYGDNVYVIGTDAKVGEWVEAELYFTNAASANDFSWLFMSLYQADLAVGDVAYFDDFALAEAEIVTFQIPEGATVDSGEKVVDGIITVYIDKGGVATAPIVIDADGNPIETWYDESGKAATEFKAGAYTYEGVDFIYGDCNGDGNIDAADLASLKLNLAGSGDVEAGADCNGDGNVDAADLASLKLYLAGSGDLGPAV